MKVTQMQKNKKGKYLVVNSTTSSQELPMCRAWKSKDLFVSLSEFNVARFNGDFFLNKSVSRNK